MSHFGAYSYPEEAHVKHFQDFEMKHARKRLEEVCERNLKACPAFEMRLVQGDPAAEILKTAQEAKADMIVLTTHGRGAEDLDQRSPEFGSVARKVLGSSPVPVHLVNPFGD
jgi:nucleotide-binding universal stress UspA family protein